MAPLRSRRAQVFEFRSILGEPELEIFVREMVDDGVEVVIACNRNADFGPVLVLGSGGLAVELYSR